MLNKLNLIVIQNVDDDTTIILEYPNKQVVIQASWNWSHNRKDMQIYGSNGYVDCQNANTMIILENEVKGPKNTSQIKFLSI